MSEERSRKAIISEGGEKITFMHEGREYQAFPSKEWMGEWMVQSPNSCVGFGKSIWAAVDDALAYAKKGEEK